MAAEEEASPSNRSTDCNDDIDLLIQRIADTSPKPCLHVRTATAFPVIVCQRRKPREQHEQDGVPPPSGCATECDDGGNAQPVNDDCADQVEEGDLVPQDALYSSLRRH